jgi:uncharacterized protein with HEPN domain
MSHRAWKFRLEDIAEALDRIFEYTLGLDYDHWLKDQKTIQENGEGCAKVKK